MEKRSSWKADSRAAAQDVFCLKETFVNAVWCKIVDGFSLFSLVFGCSFTCHNLWISVVMPLTVTKLRHSYCACPVEMLNHWTDVRVASFSLIVRSTVRSMPLILNYVTWSRGSSVQWLGFVLHDRRSIPSRIESFLLATASRPAIETTEPPAWSYQCSFLGAVRVWALCWPLSSADVKIRWSCTSTELTSPWRSA